MAAAWLSWLSVGFRRHTKSPLSMFDSSPIKPRVYVYVLLIIRLDIVYSIERWSLARPGHLWVCGRKNEPCSSFRLLVSLFALGFKLKKIYKLFLC